MKRILMIDDDILLCELIQKCLGADGFEVLFSVTGSEGLKRFEGAEELCLVLLDVMLPDFSGIQLLELIRSKSNVPVLMLTAKSDDESKVKGLKKGADDYLTKPFNLNELRARVEALVRRFLDLNPERNGRRRKIQHGDLLVDPEEREVLMAGKRIELTGKEFDLLYVLASHRGRIFTKRQLYREVWEEEPGFDDANMMSFISKLRKKIEPDLEHPRLILTVRGVGYRFAKEERE